MLTARFVNRAFGHRANFLTVRFVYRAFVHRASLHTGGGDDADEFQACVPAKF